MCFSQTEEIAKSRCQHTGVCYKHNFLVIPCQDLKKDSFNCYQKPEAQLNCNIFFLPLHPHFSFGRLAEKQTILLQSMKLGRSCVQDAQKKSSYLLSGVSFEMVLFKSRHGIIENDPFLLMTCHSIWDQPPGNSFFSTYLLVQDMSRKLGPNS